VLIESDVELRILVVREFYRGGIRDGFLTQFLQASLDWRPGLCSRSCAFSSHGGSGRQALLLQRRLNPPLQASGESGKLRGRQFQDGELVHLDGRFSWEGDERLVRSELSICKIPSVGRSLQVCIGVEL